MSLYHNALLSAFPQGNNFTPDVIAEVWAGILNANQDYMRYVSYLNPVIETNVTVERLAINAVCCYKNPLVQEALKQINITPPAMDFYKDMKDFLKMRLAWKE